MVFWQAWSVTEAEPKDFNGLEYPSRLWNVIPITIWHKVGYVGFFNSLSLRHKLAEWVYLECKEGDTLCRSTLLLWETPPPPKKSEIAEDHGIQNGRCYLARKNNGEIESWKIASCILPSWRLWHPRTPRTIFRSTRKAYVVIPDQSITNMRFH